VLRAERVIYAANPLVIGVVGRDAVLDSAARIGTERHIVLDDLEGRGIEGGDRNLIPGVRSAGDGVLQSDVAGVATGSIESAEIAIQNGSGGYKARGAGRIAFLLSSLIAAEEEEFVLDDAAPDDAAELAALQGVADQGAGLAGVEVAVAEELKEIAMEGVGAGFRDVVDGSAGVQSVLGRQGVGQNIEFLESVRERDGEVDVAEGVIVVAAVQQIVVAVGLAACNREGAGAVGALDVLAAGEIAGGGGGGAFREQEQLGWVTAVQGKIDDALLVDDL
jgi:hypothetical protein